MAEQSLFDQAGLFDEALRRLEDWDWLLRCAHHTEIGVLQEVLAIVNVEPRGRGLYPVVRNAATHMQETWCHGPSAVTSNAARRALIGTLRNELAAVAYSERKFPQAIWNIIVSLAYLPLRGREFFSRIGYRIYCDVRFLASKMLQRLLGHPERRRRRAALRAAAKAAQKPDNASGAAE